MIKNLLIINNIRQKHKKNFSKILSTKEIKENK